MQKERPYVCVTAVAVPARNKGQAEKRALQLLAESTEFRIFAVYRAHDTDRIRWSKEPSDYDWKE